MVTDFKRARNVLRRRLEEVFDPEAFRVLYPGAQPPRVFLGFPANEPPFYAAVDEVVEASATGGAVSMGHAQVEFTLRVWLCAQHTDLEAASDALLAYIDAVFGSVMADPQLCGSADNAFCSVETVGTAADSSRRYIAAASVAVQCAVYSACPASMRSAVEASNLEIRQREEAADEGDRD